ncbi:glutaredoxin family protein [Paenibacillus sp. BK033]|uniref:glutaredoxin family protein n=1 Tax=unclassified Paenibacillus TaxID=185978 RepID=UPI0010E55AFD|nr:glutaredoxin family protein [Paenibacillus sp. BK033]NIK66959.1 glutaredoxin [Paenibacillus sp. BK720]TCN01008.1 glutaredoxin [Paenibacillus sp. BK033]
MKNVVLYGADHCAACTEAIKFFQQQGIPFQYKNVGTDKEAFAEVLRLGGIATPFIVAGTHVLHSFDQQKLKESLKLHG